MSRAWVRNDYRTWRTTRLAERGVEVVYGGIVESLAHHAHAAESAGMGPDSCTQLHPCSAATEQLAPLADDAARLLASTPNEMRTERLHSYSNATTHAAEALNRRRNRLNTVARLGHHARRAQIGLQSI